MSQVRLDGLSLTSKGIGKHGILFETPAQLATLIVEGSDLGIVPDFVSVQELLGEFKQVEHTERRANALLAFLRQFRPINFEGWPKKQRGKTLIK